MTEWQQDVEADNLPPRPDWTNSYLVSGKNTEKKLMSLTTSVQWD
jgi:hypothetical protein